MCATFWNIDVSGGLWTYRASWYVRVVRTRTDTAVCRQKQVELCPKGFEAYSDWSSQRPRLIRRSDHCHWHPPSDTSETRVR